jgi:hypothetical protein
MTGELNPDRSNHTNRIVSYATMHKVVLNGSSRCRQNHFHFYSTKFSSLNYTENILMYNFSKISRIKANRE